MFIVRSPYNVVSSLAAKQIARFFVCLSLIDFLVSGWDPKVWSLKWKLSSSVYFPVMLFITLYKVFLTFESVHEFLKCDHSKES